MSDYLVLLEDISVELQGVPVLANISWKIGHNTHWAVRGPSGSGKTILSKVFLGKIPYQKGKIQYSMFPEEIDYQLKHQWIKGISFSELKTSYFARQDHYYQQRYHAYASEGHPKVKDYFDDFDLEKYSSIELIRKLGVEELMDREIIKLSSGQGRRVTLAKVLLDQPKILWLDNPYVGLDVQGRKDLNNLLKEYIELYKVCLILSGHFDELPDFISNQLWLDRGQKVEQKSKFLKTDYKLENDQVSDRVLQYFLRPTFQSIPDEILFLENGSIKSLDQVILHNISWQIRKGQKWCVFGENGVGKSTLLSLLFADHPQAYALPLRLFGVPRQSGQSIWDIKSKIGFSSSEIHTYFKHDQKLDQIIFARNINHNQPVTEEQKRVLEDLLTYFGISKYRLKQFSQLPTGIQRLVFLLKAIIFNPPLILLDEPFQAMDSDLVFKAKTLLSQILGPNHTLIFISHFDHEIPDCVNHKLVLKKS